MKRKQLIIGIIVFICMLLISVSLIFPFLWTFTTSVKTNTENIAESFQLFPSGSIFDWQWYNYTTAMDTMNYWRSFYNTLVITVPKMFGDVIISAFVAYGFARFDFKYKKPIFMFLIATLMIPFEITMIPMYIVYAKIGWIDTYLPLIVPAMFGASSFIFFLAMYFQTMPKDLVECAKIDGLSDFKIFTKIYLPLSVPALVVVSIWSFQGTWNDLLGPLIWLQSADKFTLQLSLASLTNTTTYHVDKNVIMAGTIMVMIPILILFLVFQRYILDSNKTSGIKG